MQSRYRHGSHGISKALKKHISIRAALIRSPCVLAICYDRHLELAADAKYNVQMIQTSSTASSFSQDVAKTPHQSCAEDSQVRGEQRDNTRYRCEGNVEFVTEDSEVRTFAKLTDISFGGCYVEMTATSAPGAAVHLAVEVSGIRFRCRVWLKPVIHASVWAYYLPKSLTWIKNTFTSYFSVCLVTFRKNHLLWHCPQISRQKRLSKHLHSCLRRKASSHVRNSCTWLNNSPNKYLVFSSLPPHRMTRVPNAFARSPKSHRSICIAVAAAIMQRAVRRTYCAGIRRAMILRCKSSI
jgi:hypothetical protein